MDRNASSPISAMEPEKPKHPRFEAYVMTGDTILNLSRTTHSPGSFPIHSKRRKYVPPSNTVPTSPINPIPAPAEKLGEMETVTDPILAKNDIPRLVRTSESEENVHNCKEMQKSSEPNKEEVIPSSSNGETATTDRIVWTYNAPMSEQEVRRLEADQFWSSTRREAPAKLPKLRDSSEHNSESQVDQLIETSNTRDTANETDNSTARSETPLEAGVYSSEDGSPSGSPLLSKPSIPTDEDSDADSLQSVHYSPKGVDMPSAIRLAKRLFSLDGFQKSDVSRHLSKNNDFNRVVAEEYLKHFEFENVSLDSALRRFLHAFQLTGESSERDRVLVHFSRRFLQCNPNNFASQDGVHILTCALLLLNSDLHGKHQQSFKRMTCAQFIKRLSGLNDGGNFPVDLLRRLYSAIKDQPLEWATDSVESTAEASPAVTENPSAPKELASNPYLDIPAPIHSQDFKKGYIMRKCCMEPNGKRTTLGKRSWKMYFAVLKDLILYLYKDEATCKGELPAKGSKSSKAAPRPGKSSGTAGAAGDPAPAAIIRVHHALATSAPDYTKKQNVFRLYTADRAQFLIQTSDTKEWRCWMDALNTAASLLSSPPLPAPVGSQQKFQRPLLPAGLSKLPPRDQLAHHFDRVRLLEQELLDHRANPLPANAKSALVQFYREKDAFLHYEKTRYEAYSALLERATFAPTMSRDLSLLEMDERFDSERVSSPDFKPNDEENSSSS